MKPPVVKTILEQILKDAVYHQDSIAVYDDHSWSFRRINPDKRISRMYGADAFDGKAEGVTRDLMTYHGYSRSEAMRAVKAMQEELVTARGKDHAFHYDRAERNMIVGAARIAAREPETAVLYWNYDPAQKNTKMLRFVIGQGTSIEDIYMPKDATTKPAGVAIYGNDVLAIGHQGDRTSAAVTTHELVHAYDLKLGMISNRLPKAILERTVARAKWIVAVLEKDDKKEALDADEARFMEAYRPLLKAVKKDRRLEDAPIPKMLGMSLITGLEDLPTDLYPTEAARLRELMPHYEELVAIFAPDRLKADSPGRKLCEYMFPELGGFVAEHYLKPLQADYEIIKKKGLFVLRDDDFERPCEFISHLHVRQELKGRDEKDQACRLSAEDLQTLDEHRRALAIKKTHT